MNARNIIVLLISFFAFNLAHAQVQVKLAQPPPNQLRAADLWKLTLTNTSQNTLRIRLEGTLDEGAAGRVADGQSTTLSLPPGRKTITYDDVKRGGNVNFKAGPWRNAFTRTGNAPSGDYTICITVKNEAGEELGRDCIQQRVEILSGPTLISPADGDKIPGGQPIIFTWMAPTPVPPEVRYRITIVEILGTQSPEEAMQRNPALFEKADIRTTTFTYPASARRLETMKKLIWYVTAIVGGQEVGSSEVASFTCSSCDVNLSIKLDSLQCLPSSTAGNKYRLCVTATYTSSTYNLTYSNTGSGLKAYHPSYTPAYPISNLAPALQVQTIGTTTSVHYCFEVTVPATQTAIKITLQGDDADPGPLVCQPGAALDVTLPLCVCNPCKDKSTIFGSAASTPPISYDNGGSVAVSSTVTHTPNNVIKVSAEIVNVERLGESGCVRCTKESKEFGNFTGGALNNNGGTIVNGAHGYGKQIQWQLFTTPTLISNFSYTLQMMFPPLTDVSCCKDSLRICTRWSFTDENCITCDTLVCSTIIREYTHRTLSHGGGVSGGFGPQIAMMGEPYLSWYNQGSDELPKDFEEQTKKLYDKSKGKGVEFPVFLESIKMHFYGIRQLKMGVNTVLSSNTMCGNGDFETGSIDPAEWQGATASSNVNTSNALLNTNSIYTPWVFGINPAGGLPVNSLVSVGTNHQTIVDQGAEPIEPVLLLNRVPTTPPGNLYALRLGNSLTGFGVEKIEKSFVVPSSNNVLTFWYAAVFQDPGASHTNNQRPSFHVNVYNSSGTPVSNLVFLDPSSTPKDIIFADAANPFFVVDNNPGGVRVVRDWTCAKIDLSSLAGQTVRVELVNTDCSQGAHWGYTYLDNFCLGCAGSPSGNVTIQAISDACIKPGVTVCVDYTLPTIVTTTGTTTGSGTITLKFYQSGTQIVSATMTSPTLTASSAHPYCFTIDPAKLPCTQGQTGYDVVATGNFSINGFPITVTSPSPIGNPIQGITPGMNNDLICCSTPSDNCCNGFIKNVATQVSMVGNATAGYNTIKFVPTFIAGPKPIKQVRISVVNFESSSANKECLTCESNTGRYGTMSVPQNPMGGGKDAIEGMVYPTKPITMACWPIPCPTWNTLPSSEVIWGSNNGPGYDLMDGIGDQTTTFSVSLPKQSLLSCCGDTIKVCIKYSFTDVDCKTCDTVICYKIVNRNTITTTPTLGQLGAPVKNQWEGIPNSNSGISDNNSITEVNDKYQMRSLGTDQNLERKIDDDGASYSPVGTGLLLEGLLYKPLR